MNISLKVHISILNFGSKFVGTVIVLNSFCIWHYRKVYGTSDLVDPVRRVGSTSPPKKIYRNTS